MPCQEVLLLLIGSHVKLLRKTKGLKQVKLAELAGISNSFLSDIENNRVNPSIKTLSKLAAALEINLNWDTFLLQNFDNNVFHEKSCV